MKPIRYGEDCKHEPGDPEAFATLCWHCGALLYFDSGQWRAAREAPGESGQMGYVIRLNVAQQSALLSVLVDHSLRKDSTREWIDIVNQSTVTIEDLLSLVAVASTHVPMSESNWEPMPPKLQETSFRGDVGRVAAGEARRADNLPANPPSRPGARENPPQTRKDAH